MEQLSPLDAQFLGVESPRTFGHVGMLAIYDPSTAPGGRLEMADLCRLVSQRIHLLPPLRRRLVEVPFGIDLPYRIDDPDFDLDFHIRESAVPPPADDGRLAETVARIFARPLRSPTGTTSTSGSSPTATRWTTCGRSSRGSGGRSTSSSGRSRRED